MVINFSKTFAFILLLLSTFLPNDSIAEEHQVTPETDLDQLSRKVVAGDSIVLANGTWTDSELEFEGLAGTAEKPISIMAETAGSVVLAGKTEFRVSGQHVVVSGLVFKDCLLYTSDAADE